MVLLCPHLKSTALWINLLKAGEDLEIPRYTHVDQHRPSGNDKPDDSGYVSPTDSESDDLIHFHKKKCTRDKALMANDQSSAVQLNPAAHEHRIVSTQLMIPQVQQGLQKDQIF